MRKGFGGRATGPHAPGAPGMHPWMGALPVPKLGGTLPPRTAKLAVPPRSIRTVPAERMPMDIRVDDEIRLCGDWAKPPTTAS